MANNVSIRVTGDDELARDLQGLARDLADPQAMDEIADQAARLAAQNTPRKSGTAAAGWQSETRDGLAGISNAVVYIGVIDRGWPVRNIEPARITQRTDRALEPTAVRLLEDGIDRDIRQRGLNR